MDSPPSETRQPKQARAIRTRGRILDQAERAFAAKGFEAASLTSDILEPAGISVGSFYHQFSDKRAVLYALLDERRAWGQARAVAVAMSADRTSFPDAVRAGVLELLDDVDQHPDTWWIHFREVHNADPEIRNVIRQTWLAWIASFRTVVEQWVDDPERCSDGRLSFATFGLMGILRQYLDETPSTRRRIRDELLDDVVAAIVSAFAPVTDCLPTA
jgi:AcrR family transcriptional regulator